MTMPRPLVFLLIVVLCGGLDIGLHMASGDLMPMPSAFSVLVNRVGFGAVVAVWIALAFIGMGLIFLGWAQRMSGRGWQKGLRYGLALALMIFVAMFEGVGLLGTPLIGELAMGIADAVPIFLLIAALGVTLASDSPPGPRRGNLSGWSLLLIFALVFGGGRTEVQMLGLIHSGLEERLLPSLLWPFAMGAAIGVLFAALDEVLHGLSRGTAALVFGLGVFGTNWALFMTFVPMVFPDALLDSTLRVGLDILLATGASLLAERQRQLASD
jgi:hypothetical protein